MSSNAKTFKYLDLVTVIFVASLLITITVASKLFAPIFGFYLNGGAPFIAINYICGGVLTEVYGYARARRVIWAGFFAAVYLSFGYWLVGVIPPAPTWPHQEAYNAILGVVPRIVLASLLAYCCGEFANTYLWAKLKLRTKGRYLWTRTIGSSVVGQAVDTVLFVVLAFYGTQGFAVVAKVSVSIYLLKVLIETVATPITYKIVGALKQAEGADTFDRDTNFSPFAGG